MVISKNTFDLMLLYVIIFNINVNVSDLMLEYMLKKLFCVKGKESREFFTENNIILLIAYEKKFRGGISVEKVFNGFYVSNSINYFSMWGKKF